MAFAETLATEITLAPKRDLDHLAHRLWQAHGNGTLSEDEAQELAEQLRDRQGPRPSPQSPKAPPAAFPRARRPAPRSPAPAVASGSPVRKRPPRAGFFHFRA